MKCECSESEKTLLRDTPFVNRTRVRLYCIHECFFISPLFLKRSGGRSSGARNGKKSAARRISLFRPPDRAGKAGNRQKALRPGGGSLAALRTRRRGEERFSARGDARADGEIRVARFVGRAAFFRRAKPPSRSGGSRRPGVPGEGTVRLLNKETLSGFREPMSALPGASAARVKNSLKKR